MACRIACSVDRLLVNPHCMGWNIYECLMARSMAVEMSLRRWEIMEIRR